MAPPSPPSAAAASAPPSKAAVSPVVALVVRILTFISLLISLIIVATAGVTLRSDADIDFEIKISFKKFYAYHYMMATAVIGIVYTLIQTVLTFFQMRTGNRIGGTDLYQFEFYADKVVSYLLAMGAAAGVVVAAELTRSPWSQSPGNLHFTYSIISAKATAGLVFHGFVFSAVSSVFFHLFLFQRGVSYVCRLYQKHWSTFTSAGNFRSRG